MVEVIPAYDPAGQTATLAANLAYEMLSLVALRRARRLTAMADHAELDWRDPMPPGFRWPDGVPRGRLLHVRRRRREPDPVRPSRDRRLARRHDATRPTGRGPECRGCCASSTGRGSARPSSSPATPPSAGREAVRAIRDAGHEIAHHGYLHEGARSAPDAETEERRLLRGLEALDAVARRAPGRAIARRCGSCSYRLPALLARHGFRYDSGLMDADHPYRLATGPEPGAPPIIELPGHWSLDDWEPYNYLPGITGSGVIASPADVIARWTLELEALVDEGGLFMLTNHPFISRPGLARGRPRDAHRAGAGDRRACGSRPPTRSPRTSRRSARAVVHLPHRHLPRQRWTPAVCRRGPSRCGADRVRRAARSSGREPSRRANATMNPTTYAMSA